MRFLDLKGMNNFFFRTCLTIALLFFAFFHVEAQRRKETVVRDTIWIMDGKEYTYNPLKKNIPTTSPEKDNKLVTTKTTNYRSLVDSLRLVDHLSIDLDSLASEILSKDSIFSTEWCTECVFEETDQKEFPDSIFFDLLKNSEDFYYNQWGTFFWGYGPRWGRMHRGLDLGLTTGDTIRSTFNGIVRYAEFNNGGFGNCVVVRHFNGIETLYAHMSEILVKPGQLVFTSDVLGLGGSTGRSDGPHLHFETRFKGQSFDPLKIFNKDNFTIHSNLLVLKKGDLIDPEIPRRYHVVKKGETLSQIARKYRTSISNIQKLNGIKNVNKIAVGKRLIVG